MKNEFIPYKEALALKELGFDEPCSAFYKLGDSELYFDTILQSKNVHFRTNSELNFYEDLKEKISAPLYQQAFRWFRNKLKNDFVEPYRMVVELMNNRGILFEEAELACIRKLIEIVKEKK